MSPTPGRPRDSQTTTKILETALYLSTHGDVDSVTVEKISDVSGVAKSTIYRRWPNAASIILEALIEETKIKIQYNHEEHILTDLKSIIKKLSRVIESPLGNILHNLLGKAQSDQELRSSFLEGWIIPRREEGKKAIKEAIEKGELKDSSNSESIIRSVYGPVYYNYFVIFESLSDTDIDNIIETALKDSLV